MHRGLVFAALAVVTTCSSSAFAASCPRERDDGKRLTVSGTLNYAGKESGGYGFGIEECNIYIMASRNDGGACKVGSKITATGKFFSCEAYFLAGCDPDFGDPDWMENAKVDCK